MYILNDIALNLTFKELGRLFTMMVSKATCTWNSREGHVDDQLNAEEEVEMENMIEHQPPIRNGSDVLKSINETLLMSEQFSNENNVQNQVNNPTGTAIVTRSLSAFFLRKEKTFKIIDRNLRKSVK